MLPPFYFWKGDKMNTKWIQWALKKYAPDILTGMAIGGIGLTGWLGVKAGKKAAQELRFINATNVPLTTIDEAKYTWKCYIPPLASAVATSVFVVSAHKVHLHNEAILAGVAAMYSGKYQQLTKTLGDKLDQNTLMDIRKEAYQDDPDRPPWLPTPKNSDEEIYYEPYSHQYFTASAHAMVYAMLHINRTFQEYGGVTLNDYLNVLPGCKRIPEGKNIGWYQGTDSWEEYWNGWSSCGHFIDICFEDIDDGAKMICYNIGPSVPDEDWEPFK